MIFYRKMWWYASSSVGIGSDAYAWTFSQNRDVLLTGKYNIGRFNFPLDNDVFDTTICNLKAFDVYIPNAIFNRAGNQKN
jgi:hypothetical protein